MTNQENTIFIGKKPTMSYVLAAITQFANSSEVIIKARGKNISTAVDVAEVVKNRFLKDLTHNISIGTEHVKGTDNRTLNVSTIHITLTKS